MVALGDHRFVRDYDLRGEAELVGGAHALGLPFGLALGLGCHRPARAARARSPRAGRAHRMRALGLLLVGRLVAVLAANVLVFTSSQNRVPALVPLCFAAGPALLALFGWLGRSALDFRAGPGAWTLGAALFLQALWPRGPQPSRPSSVHYFNLGAVEETLQRDEAAAEHYGRAVARKPDQPVFLLSQARVLRKRAVPPRRARRSTGSTPCPTSPATCAPLPRASGACSKITPTRRRPRAPEPLRASCRSESARAPCSAR